MKDINKLYKDFLLIQQLEAKATECMAQAEALRKKLEEQFNGTEAKTKVTKEVTTIKRSSGKRGYKLGWSYPNGPSAKVITFLNENKEKCFSRREISEKLNIPIKQAANILGRAFKNGRIAKPTYGQYKAA